MGDLFDGKQAYLARLGTVNMVPKTDLNAINSNFRFWR